MLPFYDEKTTVYDFNETLVVFILY